MCVLNLGAQTKCTLYDSMILKFKVISLLYHNY